MPDGSSETYDLMVIREELKEIQLKWSFTWSNIADHAEVPQGWLSDFLSDHEKVPSREMKDKLLKFVNKYTTLTPPNRAVSIMRDFQTAQIRAEDNKSARWVKTQIFEKQDISACAFIDKESVKILTEEDVDLMPEDSIIASGDVSHDFIAISASTPYSQIVDLFKTRSPLKAVLVAQESKDNNGTKGLFEIIGIITEREVLFASSERGMQENPARRFWNRRANAYIDLEYPTRAAEVLSERILNTFERVPSDLKVLDMGTGPGNFTFSFLKIAKAKWPKTQIHITAIDHPIHAFQNRFYERMSKRSLPLEEVSPGFGGLTLEIRKLQDENQAFDVIAFNMALPVRGTLTEPGDREPREFWKPAAELTRSGGRIAVSYYSSETLETLFSILKEVFNTHEPPRYFYSEMSGLYDKAKLEGEMKKWQFTIASSGVDTLRPSDLKTGRDVLEFLKCSLPSVDFSFVSAPSSTRLQLEKSAATAIEQALKEGKVSFGSISIVAIK